MAFEVSRGSVDVVIFFLCSLVRSCSFTARRSDCPNLRTLRYVCGETAFSLSMGTGCVYLSSAWFRAVFCSRGWIVRCDDCVYGVQRFHFVVHDRHHYYHRRLLSSSFVIVFCHRYCRHHSRHHHPRLPLHRHLHLSWGEGTTKANLLYTARRCFSPPAKS